METMRVGQAETVAHSVLEADLGRRKRWHTASLKLTSSNLSSGLLGSALRKVPANVRRRRTQPDDRGREALLDQSPAKSAPLSESQASSRTASCCCRWSRCQWIFKPSILTSMLMKQLDHENPELPVKLIDVLALAATREPL